MGCRHRIKTLNVSSIWTEDRPHNSREQFDAMNLGSVSCKLGSMQPKALVRPLYAHGQWNMPQGIRRFVLFGVVVRFVHNTSIDGRFLLLLCIFGNGGPGSRLYGSTAARRTGRPAGPLIYGGHVRGLYSSRRVPASRQMRAAAGSTGPALKPPPWHRRADPY